MKNLKMMTKLSLGFGAVLLLMILMSVINISSLGTFTQRVDNLSLINQIEDGSESLLNISSAYQIRPETRHLPKQQAWSMKFRSRRVKCNPGYKFPATATGLQKYRKWPRPMRQLSLPMPVPRKPASKQSRRRWAAVSSLTT